MYSASAGLNIVFNSKFQQGPSAPLRDPLACPAGAGTCAPAAFVSLDRPPSPVHSEPATTTILRPHGVDIEAVLSTLRVSAAIEGAPPLVPLSSIPAFSTAISTSASDPPSRIPLSSTVVESLFADDFPRDDCLTRSSLPPPLDDDEPDDSSLAPRAVASDVPPGHQTKRPTPSEVVPSQAVASVTVTTTAIVC